MESCVVLLTAIVTIVGMAEQSAVIVASAQLILLYGFTTKNLAWSLSKEETGVSETQNWTSKLVAVLAFLNFGLLVASAEIGNERFYWPYLAVSFFYALVAGDPYDSKRNSDITQSIFVQYVLLLSSVCLTVAHASVQEGDSALGTSIAAAVLAAAGDGVLTTKALYEKSSKLEPLPLTHKPWIMILYTVYFIIATPGFIHSEAAGPIALGLALAHLVGGTIEAMFSYETFWNNCNERWQKIANIIADVVIFVSMILAIASVALDDPYESTPRGLGLAGLSLATVGNVFCVYARMQE